MSPGRGSRGWPSRACRSAGRFHRAASCCRPAASSTAWGAAVSHSMVRAKRGYMSAAPSATRHTLMADPRWVTGRDFHAAEVIAQARVVVVVAGCEHDEAGFRRQAGADLAAAAGVPASRRRRRRCRRTSPAVAGTQTMPRTGSPSRTRPILTQKLSRPAAKSRVPSSGSTNQVARPGRGMWPGRYFFLGDDGDERRGRRAGRR